MECIKTREYHSFTCWPCVLAAAGSSRFGRSYLSPKESSCVRELEDLGGDHRTGTCDKPLPSGRESRGRSAGTAGGRLPPRSPQALRQAVYGAHRDSTLLVRSVSQSVSQKHFTHIISLILRPLTIVL